ncbi:hypothetical protein MNEG_7635 [Monoraphidium neglectum]|uniref:HMG box domain-containing protein n=1 Tax=Monoraphidium neglectum TaxID=145388 RepID=A0A0D2N280_9CHLO|nr:hypothetical protein MNEG_7635 [Monoraphidium neglectum]KIZ00326.1 hypothetical protein MNEG_7635 [Monoraphidium neglectum]|eukprot:XP_013899345.1 hypothetical protein MNEG_7635 [Monoraphidium neglectum]
MPPPKGPTAYFLFTEEHRAAIQKELNEAAAVAVAAAAAAAAAVTTTATVGAPPSPGQQDGAASSSGAPAKPKAVSVAVVAKELGARWRALPEDEKARYKELAQQRASEAAAVAADVGGAPGDECREDAVHGGAAADQEAGEADEQPRQPSFPLGVVKRIMAVDPDFKRATADAVWLISAAAEALLGLVAERAGKQALAKKRKTVKLEDLQHVIKYDRRLVVAGLREVAEDTAMFEAAAATAAAKAAAKPSKPKAGADEQGQLDASGGEGDAGGGKKTRQQQSGAGRGKGRRGHEEDRAQRKLSAFFTVKC